MQPTMGVFRVYPMLRKIFCKECPKPVTPLTQ